MRLDEEMPAPTFVDLKPDRFLLDPKFDGYKLSLSPLPIHSAPLPPVGVDKVGPVEDQYSIQHAKLFGLHNALHSDPFTGALFLVDGDWAVRRFDFQPETATFQEESQVVWRIPTKGARRAGRFNVNLSFPSQQHVLIGDGFSRYFLLDTGDRAEGGAGCREWSVLFEAGKVEEKETGQLGNFILLDAKLYEGSLLDVLLMRLQERTDPLIAEFLERHSEDHFLSSTQHPFITKLHWLTLKEGEGGKWSHVCTRTLIGPSALDYGCLESNGAGLLIASESHFAFQHITNEPLRYKAGRKGKGQELEKPDYVWMQNAGEVTLLFKFPFGASKNDVQVDVKATSLSVAYTGNAILEGELLHSVKSDETVWTISPVSITDGGNQEDSDVSSVNGASKQYQSLEIILQKAGTDHWEGDSAIKGGSKGQQLLDPELLANIQERLNHLCSDKWNDDPLRSKVCDSQQLEECDGFPADTTCFIRIDKNMQCISHVASLGGHQWLFSSRIGESKTPSVCIRHDVDGLIWQPVEVKPSDPTGWKLEHIGTFSAFGYVQASKQQRKFSVCPPDMSYVAICDSLKHVYIYRQPHEIGTDLRNRKTGQIVNHISKQQVVALDPPVEIFGATTTNEFLFILTAQNIHAIRVKEATEVY